MYARSITVMGDPRAMDEGVAYVRDEVMPTVTALEDCVGLSMLVDRESGQSIVTSSWLTEESMMASDLHLAPLRRRGGEIMGGTPTVETWEVAVMHRLQPAPESASCRVTWMRLGQADVERGLDIYRSAMLPELESIEGFCSASLMLDRSAGRACSTTTYSSRAAVDASRDRAWTIRDAGVRDAGVDVLDVVECDLVIAHLRVPELV
jgi:hypothetical protein